MKYIPLVFRVLAYAEAGDPSELHLLTILLCAGVIAVVGALAFVPFALATRRLPRYLDRVTVAVVLWGLLAAASAVYATSAQLKWSKERPLRLQSGYYDPRDESGAPAMPWGTWSALAIGYVALLLWPLVGPKAGDSPPAVKRLCPRCGYDLRASPGRCPECGETVSRKA